MFQTPLYAELACTNNFTFLSGASHPQELVARAAELGYTAIAITDECLLAGVVRALEEGQLRAPKQPVLSNTDSAENSLEVAYTQSVAMPRSHVLLIRFFTAITI